MRYIGARYVVKIYENSLDPSSAEWEASVNYEPLTMVTYNNGSYLSKTTVPGSIGDPSSNPSYWVQTGFYNGQIADLQNQIDTINLKLGSSALNTTAQNVSDAINELLSDIQNIQLNIEKRYVLIMDSYGTYPDDTLLNTIASYLNIDAADCMAAGGIGFTNVNGQGTFEELLTANIGNISNKDKVDGVIVLGGANDYGGNLANIRNAIQSFCTYAKAQMSNAEIMIGCLSRAYQGRSNADAHKIAINAYRSCFMYGARYLNNTEFIMHWKVLYYDFVHPASGNAPRIAYGVAQAVVYGSCDVEYNASRSFTAKSLSGIFSTMSVTTGCGYEQHMYNGAGMFDVTGAITLTNSTPVNLQSQDIDLEESLSDSEILFIGTASVPYRVSVPCIFRASLNDTEVRVGRCLLYIYDINNVHVKFVDWTPVSCDKVIIESYTSTPVDVSYC